MPPRQRVALFLVALIAVLIPLISSTATAQITGRQADPDRLRDLAARNAAAEAAARTPLYERLIAVKTGPMGAINADPDLTLIGIDEWGHPIVLGSENLTSAESIGTDRLWPGGDTGLGLRGLNQPRQLGIWDIGSVRSTHREFNNRVTLMDPLSEPKNHATHVAGTMTAQGLSAQAHGMSPLAYLDSYDTNGDRSEMASAAILGLRLSNHSYGLVCGWRYTNNEWYWYGTPVISETEDFRFGFYGLVPIDYDEISYEAPHYLIVKSNGNDRDDTGPLPGEPYWAWDSGLSDWVSSTLPRDPDGGASGYDCVPADKCAKNILSVGAVADVYGGWAGPESVAMSGFSSWGPTDDGRIKPDLVANGVGLYSSTAAADNAYNIFSGTSMAAPSVTGSLNLLLGHFEDTHGWAPRSATVKALAIHTADETGPAPGPDYSFGWGLFNSVGYAELISDDAAVGNRIIESTHVANTTSAYGFYSDGVEPITVTVCWTDLPGTMPDVVVDPPDLALVNDLDLRLEHLASGTVHLPWVLDPADPSAPATTGDNFRDNVEQIAVAAPAAGWYRITVEDGNVLSTATQDYSLIQSGLRQVFHVATGGSAAATGTPDDPFATVAQAQSSLLGTGQVVLQPGTYTQAPLVVAPDVVIRGETGDPRDVVITGGGFVYRGTSGRLADLTLRGIPDVAISCVDGAGPLIEGCVLDTNAGAFAGAISCVGSSPTIRNCTLALNQGIATIVVSGGGVATIERSILAYNSGSAALVYEVGSEAIFTCCDLYENAGGNWMPPFDDQVDLRGNFSADPCFCDIAGGDFSLSEGSWALPGEHPWGCYEIVGALGVGCATRECGGVVATVVSGFAVDQVADGVRVHWTAKGTDDPDRFRVTRGAGFGAVPIPITANGDGRFAAIDRGVAPDGLSIGYALYIEAGGGWALAADGHITLPRLATELRSVTPNPFNPKTEILFTVGARKHVRLEICDLTGRRLGVLRNEVMAAGEHEVPWSGRDATGRPVASGTYVARMITDEGVQTLKLLLLR